MTALEWVIAILWGICSVLFAIISIKQYVDAVKVAREEYRRRKERE